MQASNEAWIQDSLARLEQLESQREHFAASGRADLLAELDEEIRNLYEALEAAADGGDNDAAANSPQWSPAPQAYAPVPAPPFAQPPVAIAPQPAPFAAPSPFAAEPAPFAAAPMSAAPQPVDYGSASMDDDVSGGSKTPIIVAALVAVLAIGGAGAWYMTRAPVEEPKPTAPAGEAKVLKAGEIPPDTQDPNVAKGGDADRTPLQVIKERAESDRRPASRPSSSSGPSRPREPEKPTRGPIKVGSSDDPLAGVK